MNELPQLADAADGGLDRWHSYLWPPGKFDPGVVANSDRWVSATLTPSIVQRNGGRVAGLLARDGRPW